MKIRSMLIVALASGVTSAAFAQVPQPALPWFLRFEQPEYPLGVSLAPTGSAPNIVYIDGWAGGGGYTPTTVSAQSGTQSIRFNGPSFPSGGSFNGFRKFPPILNENGGTFVLTWMNQVVNNPANAGRSAFEMSWYGSAFSITGTSLTSNRKVVALGVNDFGEIFLRQRDDTAPLKANQTLTTGSWVKFTLVYHQPTWSGIAFMNDMPLTDALNVPLLVTIPEGTAAGGPRDFWRINEVDLWSYVGVTPSRLAYGIPATEIRGQDLWYIDNLRAEHFPNPRTIRASVTLNDFAGTGRPITNIAVEVILTPTGGEPLPAQTVTLNSLGEFTVEAPSEGAYDIRVKPFNWLSSSVSNVSVTNRGVFNLSFVARNGDVNRDGIVDGNDVNSVLATFGEEGDNLLTDANGDGIIDGNDINVLLANFGEEDA